MIAAGAIALWLIVWIVTGGSVVWLVLAILISVLGFVFRLGRSYKKELGLAPRGRRARSGRRSLM